MLDPGHTYQTDVVGCDYLLLDYSTTQISSFGVCVEQMMAAVTVVQVLILQQYFIDRTVTTSPLFPVVSLCV